MLAAKVFLCSMLVVLLAGSWAQADDKTACPVEEVQLSMLKKQRDGEERRIAELAARLEQSMHEVETLKKEVAALKKAAEKPKE